MLKLKLVADYELFLAPLIERKPSLDVWLTRNVSEDYHVIELAQNVTGSSATGVLRTEMAFHLLEPLEDAVQALGAAYLNIDAFAIMTNKHGERCRNQAGCMRVPLALLFGPKDDGTRTAQPLLQTEFVFPMLDEPKGSMTFHVLESQLLLNDKPLAETRVAKWLVRRQPMSPLEDFIEQCEELFGPSNLHSTWECLSNVNLFRYVCRVGCLPAAAYIEASLGQTPPEYYLNAAKLALRRMSLTEEQVLNKWDLSTNRDHCRFATYWLAHTLSLYVQVCDYIGDQVVARTKEGFRVTPVEWFAWPRIRNGALDCEDGASETMIEAGELENLKTDIPLLKLLQRIKRAFYMVLLLDGVSAVEINLEHAPDSMAAHMNSALVSKYQMSRWARYPPLCSEHGPTPQELEAAKPYPPIVMLEGTGPLDPNGVEDARDDSEAMSAMQEALSHHPALAGKMRQLFHYDSSGVHQSTFYKTVKMLSSAEMAYRGCGNYLWLLCPMPAATTSPGIGNNIIVASAANAKPVRIACHSAEARQASSTALGVVKAATRQCAKVTAGVTFQEMAAASERILAIAETPLSADEQQVARYYKLDLHPMPALTAPDESKSAPSHVLHAREQMRKFVAELKRIVGKAPATDLRTAHRAVYLIKFHNFDHGEKTLRELVSMMNERLTRHRLVGFEVREERVTFDRGQFWMHFYFVKI